MGNVYLVYALMHEYTAVSTIFSDPILDTILTLAATSTSCDTTTQSEYIGSKINSVPSKISSIAKHYLAFIESLIESGESDSNKNNNNGSGGKQYSAKQVGKKLFHV